MEEQYILGHVEDFSAEQLADLIVQEKVTLDKLRKTELLDNSKRIAITKLLKVSEEEKKKAQAERDKADDESWEAVRFSPEHVIIDWIHNNPENRNISKAKERVNFLQAEREKCKNQKSGILEKIGRNPNSYNPSQIVEFLKKGIVSEQDLLDCNIPQSAIDNLEKVSSPMLTLGETPRPDDIPQGFTEVYFWGIPGSGKTCALGAVLHMAEKKGYLNIASSKGAKYAYQIKSIFSDDNIANDFLPSPTPLETTQYIPFILRKPNERHSRSVSLIEISGEIFTCFFSKHVHQPYPTQSHEDTFNSLETFLNSNNRKIHFFFIDYGRENKPMQDNLLQSDYLDAAASYFKSNKILEKKTDAIYIVLTKSDLMLDEHNNFLPPESRVEYAKQYLKNDNYNAFINTLKDSCKKFSINGGKLTVEPFSLGKVYFNTICNFEGSAASNIVDILMERIRPRGNNILDVFNK